MKVQVHELVYSLDTIDSVAQDIVALFPLVSVVTFTGSLGAGKTTLIQAILRQFSIRDTVQSPTFTYLSTYTNLEGYTFYHFDLYRIKSLQGFIDAGFDEYLYEPSSWALIEWPEVIAPLIKKRVCALALEYAGENKRRLRYTIT